MLKACCLLLVTLLPAKADDLVRSLETVEKQAAASAKTASDAEKARLSVQLAEFHQRFNQVLDAMREFSDEYNRSPGNVWPAAKAEKLNTAMRRLQKTPMWNQYVAKSKATAPGE